MITRPPIRGIKRQGRVWHNNGHQVRKSDSGKYTGNYRSSSEHSGDWGVFRFNSSEKLNVHISFFINYHIKIFKKTFTLGSKLWPETTHILRWVQKERYPSRRHNPNVSSQAIIFQLRWGDNYKVGNMAGIKIVTSLE